MKLPRDLSGQSLVKHLTKCWADSLGLTALA